MHMRPFKYARLRPSLWITRRTTSCPLSSAMPAASSFAAMREPGSTSKSASTVASRSPFRTRSGARASAEDEPERVDEHRFSGARLPREDVETGTWLERHLLDENQVLRRELEQHGALFRPLSLRNTSHF